MSTRHWQDPINLILGLWVLISPWVLAYTASSNATGNAVVVGILVAVAGLLATTQWQMWEEWAELVLGIWLIISPWVLGFSDVKSATYNDVILGIVIAVLGAWSLATTRNPGGLSNA
jgi:hypothetical protein